MRISATPPEMQENVQADSSVSHAWHQHVLAERLRRLDAGSEPTYLWTEAKERIRSQSIADSLGANPASSTERVG